MTERFDPGYRLHCIAYPCANTLCLTRLRMPLIQRNQNLVEPRRVLAPSAQCIWGFLKRDNRTHRLIDRKLPLFEKSNHRAKVFRQSVPRSANVQFLLHEELGLIAHGLFGVPDIYDSAREANLFDGSAEGRR